jgi:tripartite-type tricarboxylate transporter receptor subunit TctC
LPETPTFAELGYPAVISSSWFGLAAPVNTPTNIVDRLGRAMQQVFASPVYQEGLKKVGNEQLTFTPEQSAAFIRAEVEKWAAVAKSANVQVD